MSPIKKYLDKDASKVDTGSPLFGGLKRMELQLALSMGLVRS